MTTASSRPRRSFLLKKTTIIFAAVVLAVVFLVPYFVNARFQKVETMLGSIKQTLITPHENQEIAIHKLGTVWTDYLNCTDVVCPNIHGNWFVAVEEGQEQKLVEKALVDNGFELSIKGSQCSLRETNGCGASGHKKDDYGLKASIGIDIIDGETPPTKDVSPLVWRKVVVNVQHS